MKHTVSFKCTDWDMQLNDMFEDREQIQNFKEFVDTFMTYGEYLDIVFDDEEGTATIRKP